MTDYYKDEQQVIDECKPFDISEYEFSDEAARFVKGSSDFIVLSTDRDLSLNKRDAIALAKHFKLTVEYLK